MTITVGVNSYISLTDASAYFADRLYSTTWDYADAGDQERALKMATAILDREHYVGSITSTTQILAWPRQGVSDPEGRPIASTVIPPAIEAATCELAMRLLEDDLTVDDPTRSVRRVRERVDVLETETEYDGRAAPKQLPDVVQSLIAPYLSAPPLVGSIKLVL